MVSSVRDLGRASSFDRMVLVDLASSDGRQFCRVRILKRDGDRWAKGRDLAIRLGEALEVAEALVRAIEGTPRPERRAKVEELRRRIGELEARGKR